MAQKTRKWLPLPQLPTSSPGIQETDSPCDSDYENDCDGVISMCPKAEDVPSTMKQTRDVKKHNDVSSDFDYENDDDDDDGGGVNSVLSEIGKVPLAMKQGREKEKQSDSESTRGKGCQEKLPLRILYCLGVMCFAMCASLLSLFLVKCSLTEKANLTSVLKELAELQRENRKIAKDVVQVLEGLDDLTGNLTVVPEELAELQKKNEKIAKDVIRVQEVLHNLTDFFCLSCPRNWQHFERNCYFFSTLRASWTSAKQSCEAEGAHLVIINNKAEQKFLAERMIGSQVAWIGLHDTVTEGQWFWVDGTPLSLSFWNSGEPNNAGQGGEDCGRLRFDEKWNDVHCSKSDFWICEQKC